MAGAARRQKDAAMAADLKARGVKRTTGRCPICYGLIPLTNMQAHIERQCKANERK